MSTTSRGRRKDAISESPSMNRFRSHQTLPISTVSEPLTSRPNKSKSNTVDTFSIVAQSPEQVAVQSQIEADHLTSALLRVFFSLEFR